MSIKKNIVKKIIAVTGARSDYGHMQAVYKKLIQCPQIDFGLLVCGMHLSPEFGNTVDMIKKDGYRIDGKVDMLFIGDSQESMGKSIGVGILGMVQVLADKRPDTVIVFGDRTEAFAGAITAAYMNIPLVHVQGGDAVQGSNIDDSVRYAITKLAHIHFTATKKHAERIEGLGEERWRIHISGSPGLDTIFQMKFLSKKFLKKKCNISFNKKLMLVLQHPTTISYDKAYNEMRTTLEAVREFDSEVVVIYPNSDAGSKVIIRAINEYSKFKNIHIYKNLPYLDFLSLLRQADVLVGNSSSGIIEAPSFKLPVINIGLRQRGREHADNIIDVDHNKKQIVSAIRTAFYDEDFLRRVEKCVNPYGDGKAADRIVKVLSEIRINRRLLQKKITY